MRRFMIICMCLVCVIFLVAIPVYAQRQDTNVVLNQLNNELQNAGAFTPEELKTIHKPVKNMLERGATKEDLKKLLWDLSNKGVRGEDLRSSVNSMNDLVNRGENPKEVGNIVSQAAHQAQAQGLKGKDLAAKVHAAIRQRKMQKLQTKQQKMQQKMEWKEKRHMPGGMGKGKGKL